MGNVPLSEISSESILRAQGNNDIRGADNADFASAVRQIAALSRQSLNIAVDTGHQRTKLLRIGERANGDNRHVFRCDSI